MTPSRKRSAGGSLIVALVFAGSAFGAAPAPAIRKGTDGFVTHSPGELPLVLTAPHGGSLRPDAIPTRQEGVTGADLNSQELAIAITRELRARTGRSADLVASQLHRSKLDPNREIKEGAAGNPVAERAWREFHGFIDAAIATAIERHGFAFIVDVHGHAHAIERLELGYALHEAQLNQEDAAFDRSDFAALSTLRDLYARKRGSGAALIRGPRSLGALFTQRRIRAVPSPAEPGPGQEPYFTGGYTIRRFASADGTPKVDGVQIEVPRSLRLDPEERRKLAGIIAEVLLDFLREHYDFRVEPAGAGHGRPKGSGTE